MLVGEHLRVVEIEQESIELLDLNILFFELLCELRLNTLPKNSKNSSIFALHQDNIRKRILDQVVPHVIIKFILLKQKLAPFDFSLVELLNLLFQEGISLSLSSVQDVRLEQGPLIN